MMRSHPLRHVIIWFVIAIVLFPVLWIFTTSIRRDNAYISSSLFSNQTTWQNYVDLIIEPKNVPALYNEISNIYSLGEPYNKMSKQEILSKLNDDFSAYERYFNSTLERVHSMEKDANWIENNVIPSAEKIAVENVKKNGNEDVEYLNSLSSRLLKDYSSLSEAQKMAGSYEILKEFKESPTPQALKFIEKHFPAVAQSWENYSKASQEYAKKIANVPSEVSKLFERNKISGEEASTLVSAYKETYEMMKNGDFSYSKWFAPIYLRKINMNTVKISQRLQGNDRAELLKTKVEIFSTVQELNKVRTSYENTLNSAIEKAESAYDGLLGSLQKSVSSLNDLYSEKEAELNRLRSEIAKYESLLTKDASQIALFSTNIIPTSIALDEFSSVAKTALGDKKLPVRTGTNLYDFSQYIDLTQQWLSLIPKEKDFSEVTQRVENILKDLNYLQSQNKLMGYYSNLDAISNIKSSLPFVMIKLKSSLKMSIPVLQNYVSTSKLLTSDYQKIKQITSEIATLSKKISPLQEKLRALSSKLSIVSLYYNVETKKDALKNEFDSIKSFESAQKFLNDLNTFYANVENSSISLPKPPSYSRYKDFFNVKKLKDAMQLTLVTTSDLKTLISKYSSYISDLKSRSNSYVEVNLLGFPLIVKELSSINSTYQKMYVSKISPNLGIVSRQTHDLAELKYFSKASSKLNDINDKAYYITQDWKVKYVPPFMRWLLNSIIVAGTAAVITVFLSAFMAYPFSRFRFVGRKYGLIGLLLVQMFPTMMAMVALYLLLNFIGKFFPPLGLNTLGGLTFLYIGGGIAFNAWLIKGFFDAIPKELEEAAMVDGATRFQTFWRIILPLSAPVLAVTTILGFVGNYGDYILASIVLTGINHYTYAVGLQTFSTSQYSTNWGLMTAAALIGMIPILAIFLGLQRFIVGGLTQGSVKG